MQATTGQEMTPKQLMVEMYAELLQLRFVVSCLSAQYHVEQPRMKPFDKLDTKIKNGYLERAERIVAAIQDPLWQALLAEPEPEPAIEEAAEAQNTAIEDSQGQNTEDIKLDAIENELWYKTPFYDAKTTDLSQIA